MLHHVYITNILGEGKNHRKPAKEGITKSRFTYLSFPCKEIQVIHSLQNQSKHAS